jgi:hypothetical protein
MYMGPDVGATESATAGSAEEPEVEGHILRSGPERVYGPDEPGMKY